MKKKISKRFLAGFFAVALSLSLGATAMALGPQEQPTAADAALSEQDGLSGQQGAPAGRSRAGRL